LPDLSQSQFAVAFDFARSVAAERRDATGTLVAAAIDTPRFDHSASGKPRGLLVTPGVELGSQDRVLLDELMLPAALVEEADLTAREATVFHTFRPFSAAQLDQAQWSAGIERRAFYTREAKLVIEQLLRAAGHHLAIGVHAGFAKNRAGWVRFRGKLWRLPSRLHVGTGVLAGDETRDLITSGARLAD
jgi:hypothetical protein